MFISIVHTQKEEKWYVIRGEQSFSLIQQHTQGLL